MAHKLLVEQARTLVYAMTPLPPENPEPSPSESFPPIWQVE